MKSKLQLDENFGIYFLLIYLPKSCKIEVGKLGKINFDRGYYVYLGSAQRNLLQRLLRHLRKNKKLHWHIDYLLQHGKIIKIFISSLPKKYEEIIARECSNIFPCISCFGSSDTKAKSHLFIINDIFSFKNELKKYGFQKISLSDLK